MAIKDGQGDFTLPGEAGYEDLTLQLAARWGADVIRDSDGTKLSDQIINSGYDIYSTICTIRNENDWARQHPDMLQQTVLMSRPAVSSGGGLEIRLLDGFSKDQFRVNFQDPPYEWWQVFDRTSGEPVQPDGWRFDEAAGTVTLVDTVPWHRYTVNFFVWRIWEEISAYNHITNHWGDREHEQPIDPVYPEAQARILESLETWLAGHPHTRVVRFTSMFYNFFWLWSDNPAAPFIMNDCGSYGFTVSPYSLRLFEDKYGYRLSSEDFINQGRYTNSYLAPSPHYRDWMDHVIGFVTGFSRACVELVHRYQKKAFVFYNDHWIGLEPSMPRFAEIGFDGIIDGIFSGFETRKTAAVKSVATRELRLHPYFFPTGVNGAGSFVEGGDPALECKTYWQDIRRALLRDCVDRIGFGGYLHLVADYPDFVGYIAHLADEFRTVKALHSRGKPYGTGLKVAVLTAWGQQRAWACCGHFNHGNPYNEAMESLSGLPVETVFISFDDILSEGIPEDIDVILNAGRLGDAWSGARHWENPQVMSILTGWVARGGGLVGIADATAAAGRMDYFQLAEVFGVEKESGLTPMFTKAQPALIAEHYITATLFGKAPALGQTVSGVYPLGPTAAILAVEGKDVAMAANAFHQGRSVYLAGYVHSNENTRLLERAIRWAAGRENEAVDWTSGNVHVECAYFPDAGQLVVINNSTVPQTTAIPGGGREYAVQLEPYGLQLVDIPQ